MQLNGNKNKTLRPKLEQNKYRLIHINYIQNILQYFILLFTNCGLNTNKFT